MNLQRSAAWAGLLAAVAIAVLAFSTRSLPALAAARLPFMALAAALYTTGFMAFSAVWCSLLLNGRPAPTGPTAPPISGYRSVAVSFAALAGLLTPMNAGTDVLRSFLGKKYLGVEISTSAASSVATREIKFHATFLLALAVAATASSYAPGYASRFLVVLSGLAGIILLILLIRSRFAERIAHPLGWDPLVRKLRTLNSRIDWRMRILFYIAFLLGFVAECGSVSLCFRAVNIAADLRMTFAVYGTLYFLARVPVVPLGIGLVETGGFGFLRLMGVVTEQAGALIVLWGFLRIAVPYALAAAAALILLFTARHRCRRPPSR